MNQKTEMKRTKCTICSGLSLNANENGENFCEKYFLNFLIDLREKFHDPNQTEEYFQNSAFDDNDHINQISCTGLTLMHVNVLGGREDSNGNESEQGNLAFMPLYEENVAMEICQLLLKRGASPHGNSFYEMRPLHIAIRRQWTRMTRLLLEAGANPSLPEKDMYASRPMDIAVVNDDPETVELLHTFGASLNGVKSMFYLTPLAEAFMRGYYDVFKVLLERGAKPVLDLHWNTFRSFGKQLFDIGTKGRQRFVQLMYDHGADIETEFRLHTIRIEPNGITDFEPRYAFCCDPIYIGDLDSAIFIKWMCKCRSLKELCRLTIRRYLFKTFKNGFKCLLDLKQQCSLNDRLYRYVMFKNAI
ncbi:unnamed protein product [Adineta ricciae]|uniref:Uncharacterized protein n=1 Tax=Adineta ricciae TaxID=249248 RepID=A0A813U1V3_ADIRI|nr:unnamed protein product [Adineta ricciae]